MKFSKMFNLSSIINSTYSGPVPLGFVTAFRRLGKKNKININNLKTCKVNKNKIY